MRHLRSWFNIVVVAGYIFGSAFAVPAAQAQQGPHAHGAVVGLKGTPHLWIADEQGVLHWGGDTRALAGKHIAWSNRIEVCLPRLRTWPVGDPWLSAGLLKDGDPIYQVKWETEWSQWRASGDPERLSPGLVAPGLRVSGRGGIPTFIEGRLAVARGTNTPSQKCHLSLDSGRKGQEDEL